MPPPSRTMVWPLIEAASGDASQNDGGGHLLRVEQPAERRCGRQRRLARGLVAARRAHDVGHRALRHLGGDEGRADRVHTDPRTRDLGGGRAHQADRGVLGRRVGGGVGRADAARGRGDGDDRALVALAHAAEHRAGAEEGAGGVDREVAGPGLERRARQRRALRDARVVDEHVDGADGAERLGDLVLVGDVAGARLDGPARDAERLAQRAQRLRVAPERDDPVAVCRERRHRRPADPLGAPGHHDDAAHAKARISVLPATAKFYMAPR